MKREDIKKLFDEPLFRSDWCCGAMPAIGEPFTRDKLNAMRKSIAEGLAITMKLEGIAEYAPAFRPASGSGWHRFSAREVLTLAALFRAEDYLACKRSKTVDIYRNAFRSLMLPIEGLPEDPLLDILEFWYAGHAVYLCSMETSFVVGEPWWTLRADQPEIADQPLIALPLAPVFEGALSVLNWHAQKTSVTFPIPQLRETKEDTPAWLQRLNQIVQTESGIKNNTVTLTVKGHTVTDISYRRGRFGPMTNVKRLEKDPGTTSVEMLLVDGQNNGFIQQKSFCFTRPSKPRRKPKVRDA